MYSFTGLICVSRPLHVNQGSPALQIVADQPWQQHTTLGGRLLCLCPYLDNHHLVLSHQLVENIQHHHR
jgi:hypothetical protein